MTTSTTPASTPGAPAPDFDARAHPRYVLGHLHHGGHAVPDTAPQAQDADRRDAGVSLLSAALPAESEPRTTAFDYLFPALVGSADSHLPAGTTEVRATVVRALRDLGAGMVEDPPSSLDPLQGQHNSVNPPVYTYWGQFIDHDMTAATESDPVAFDLTRDDLAPLDPDVVRTAMRNLRHPALDLDSLYGDGPALDGATTQAAGFYDGIRFALGEAAVTTTDPAGSIPGQRIPPVDDLARDLPRDGSVARIGDGRNDENLIVAQLHVALLRFHNAVVDWVEAHEPAYGQSPAQTFARARQLVTWHYQWLVVHDFLKTVCLAGMADQVLLAGPHHFHASSSTPVQPLEFSGAAYRFGHSMVRDVYDFNRNFGRGAGVLPAAPFSLLFAFTGGAVPPFRGDTAVLPFNWIIEWDRMVDKGSTVPDQFARRIDTRLAPTLRDLGNEGNSPELSPSMRQIQKRLAVRNLLRGYLLNLPTGQAVAEAMGAAPLAPQQLLQDNPVTVNDALRAEGADLLTRTPLWFYVLKEAEVQGNGNTLGEVGSRIVCETIIGQVIADPYGFLASPGGWSPAAGVRFEDGGVIATISDLLRFAGVLPAAA
ncbi:hypothetical protein GHK92_08455 [Nocardioides sp. dk4132]|uniref:peroxidase family protein n=1 Tax=unclassified Nocardioides TaxID=2615069 RepID=UPI00129538BD|nr:MULTISPECIES: heme peroxidase family protein [unclassified Nocardioides]MQW75902.1 hypothetical protein [Nocardioides sp. dk4132]QGA08763.1 hypothetical protein GFH29_16215 [Nocardioides sp. dk884]